MSLDEKQVDAFHEDYEDGKHAVATAYDELSPKPSDVSATAPILEMHTNASRTPKILSTGPLASRSPASSRLLYWQDWAA